MRLYESAKIENFFHSLRQIFEAEEKRKNSYSQKSRLKT
jgi:hypothetical protein